MAQSNILKLLDALMPLIKELWLDDDGKVSADKRRKRITVLFSVIAILWITTDPIENISLVTNMVNVALGKPIITQELDDSHNSHIVKLMEHQLNDKYAEINLLSKKLEELSLNFSGCLAERENLLKQHTLVLNQSQPTNDPVATEEPVTETGVSDVYTKLQKLRNRQ